LYGERNVLSISKEPLINLTRHIELDLGEDEILGLMKGLELSITLRNELSFSVRKLIWKKLKNSLTEPYQNSVSKTYPDYWSQER
jgi:hypothetical protein